MATTGTTTYDNFISNATAAGLLSEFSAADLALAEKYPEFGESLLTLKQEYHSSGTDEGKALANTQANALRSSYGNYTSGADGASYVSNGLAPSSYNSGGYTGTYSGDISALASSLANYTYDPDSDALYQSYANTYQREGARAMDDTIGQVSARTGGLASSYATTAANQTYNNYMSALADKIPELYQQHYDNQLSSLSALSSLDNTEYSRYADTRDFDYGQLLDGISYNDANQADSQALAQAQVDYLLQNGDSPSAQLLTASGYSEDYVKSALAAWALQQATASASTSSYSGSSGSGSTSSGSAYDTALAAAQQKLAAGTSLDAISAELDQLVSLGQLTSTQKAAIVADLQGSSGGAQTSGSNMIGGMTTDTLDDYVTQMYQRYLNAKAQGKNFQPNWGNFTDTRFSDAQTAYMNQQLAAYGASLNWS